MRKLAVTHLQIVSAGERLAAVVAREPSLRVSLLQRGQFSCLESRFAVALTLFIGLTVVRALPVRLVGLLFSMLLGPGPAVGGPFLLWLASGGGMLV